MLRAIAWVMVLVAVGIAGCVDEEPQESDTTPTTPLEQQFLQPETVPVEAPPAAQYTRDDWFLMTTAATPEGGLSSFRFRVPNGSIVQDGLWDDQQWLVFEVVPVFGNETPSAWALMAFLDAGGEARTQFSAASAASASDSSTLDLFDAEVEVSDRPFYVFVDGDDLSAGDEMYFIVGGATDIASDFGFALRILEEDPWQESGYQWPSETFAEFKKQTGNRTPALPQRMAHGSGLDVAYYVDVATLVGVQYSYQTASATVADQSIARVGAVNVQRDTMITTEFPTPAGYSIGAGLYWPEDGIGSWSIDGDIHGTPMAHEGTVLRADVVPYSSIATTTLAGLPTFWFEAGGDRGSDLAFHIEATSAGTFEYLIFEQVTLGAPLPELIGLEPRVDGYVYPALLQTGPRQGELRIDLGGVQHILLVDDEGGDAGQK